MEKIFRNTIALDLQDTMKSITLPTLMIWWNNDNQTPLSEWNIMHKHIGGSLLQVLDWTHFVHQEKPETITEMILHFTKK
jgi:pimeloyl-ACP methyl ester carboxylesterase